MQTNYQLLAKRPTASRLLSTETHNTLKVKKYIGKNGGYFASLDKDSRSYGDGVLKHVSINTVSPINPSFFSGSTQTYIECKLNGAGIRGFLKELECRIQLTNTETQTTTLIIPAGIFSKTVPSIAGREDVFQTSLDDRVNTLTHLANDFSEVRDPTNICTRYGISTSYSPNISIAQNATASFSVPVAWFKNSYICPDRIGADFTIRFYAPGYPLSRNALSNANNTQLQLVSFTLIAKYIESDEYRESLVAPIINYSAWFPRVESWAVSGSVQNNKLQIQTNRGLVGPGLYFCWLQNNATAATAGGRFTFSNNIGSIYFEDSNSNRFSFGPNIIDYSTAELNKLAAELFNSSFFGDSTPSNIYIPLCISPNPSATLKNLGRFGSLFWPISDMYYINVNLAATDSNSYTFTLVGIYYSDYVFSGATCIEIPA